MPVQKNITFENVNVLHSGNRPFLEVVTPVDSVTFINCDLNQTNLAFVPKVGRITLPTYGVSVLRLQ